MEAWLVEVDFVVTPPRDSYAAGSCAATERWSSRLTITAPDNIEPAGLAIIVFYDTMLHIT